MKVLLIVDMQKGFMKNDKYLLLNQKIANLINKKIYDKLIFTKFINDKSKNALYQSRLNWHRLKTKDEQMFSIKVPDDAVILEKYGYGLKIEDLEYIKSLNINEIDICGLKAEDCVHAIALQLWDNGIYPNLLTEYIVGDYDMKAIYKHQFGK